MKDKILQDNFFDQSYKMYKNDAKYKILIYLMRLLYTKNLKTLGVFFSKNFNFETHQK